jgi:hypothetical protein
MRALTEAERLLLEAMIRHVVEPDQYTLGLIAQSE